MNACPLSFKHTQHGIAAVEFSLVAVILFALLFGIIELGRLFFTINSVQEITRRAAREQVVRWIDNPDAVQRMALLRPGSTGTVNFPGSPDITHTDSNSTHVQLSFLNQSFTAIPNGSLPTSSADNIEKCLAGESNCIKFVQATLANTDGSQLDFRVIAPYLPTPFSGIRKPSNEFLLPRSTVIMPAEALGLL